MQHLEKHSILYDLQHGFRSARSCETQLVSFIQELVSSTDKNIQTDVIVMDFAKAFDKVPHKRLLYKLKYYGISNNLKVTSPKIKERAYQSIVRPRLEYNSCTWDPHHQYQIHQLEMVQRRAARYVTNRFHNTSSVNSMLTDLNWPTLQQRRLRTRLIFFYKITHNFVAIYPSNLLFPIDSRTRHHNPHSFYPQTVIQWNQLPSTVTSANTLVAFKEQLSMPVLSTTFC